MELFGRLGMLGLLRAQSLLLQKKLLLLQERTLSCNGLQTFNTSGLINLVI